MTTRYPIVMLSTDAALLDPSSDVALRMQEYAALYSEIHIFTSAFDKQGRGYIELSDAVFVYPAKSTNKLNTLWQMYRRARGLMSERGIRCVIAQDPFMVGKVAYLLTWHGRGRFVVGLYGTDPSNPFFSSESLKHRLYALVARFILPRADAIQTDGPETVDRLRTVYGDKVFFKPMFPANAGVLTNAVRAVPPGPFRLLFVGRFVPQKNLKLLVDVMVELKKLMGNGIRISLVGGGPLKTWFINELKQRECLDICDDIGTVSREKIPELYATHHALILTSYYEGFPRVFMESAITGLPVVTTDVGGVQDLIVDGMGGFVLPQGSTGEDIAQKVATLASDPGLLASFSQNIKERWGVMYGNKTVLDYQRPLAEYVGACVATQTSRGGVIVRFVVSGGAGFLVQVGLLAVCTEFFHIWYVASGTIAFIFSQTTSFVLQKFWTFSDYNKNNIHHQAVAFVSIGLVGVVVNAFLLFWFVDVLHLHYLLAQVFSSVMLAFLTFYVYSSHIFSNEKSLI